MQWQLRTEMIAAITIPFALHKPDLAPRGSSLQVSEALAKITPMKLEGTHVLLSEDDGRI